MKSRFLEDHQSYGCKWCQGDIPVGKKSFCSDACVYEWNLRRSNSFLRQETFNRDKGVCAECSLDTYKLRIELYELDECSRAPRLEKLGITSKVLKRSLWESDHKRAVVDGGGCSGLLNIQTLCIWCHKKKTKESRRNVKSR